RGDRAQREEDRRRDRPRTEAEIPPEGDPGLPDLWRRGPRRLGEVPQPQNPGGEVGGVNRTGRIAPHGPWGAILPVRFSPAHARRISATGLDIIRRVGSQEPTRPASTQTANVAP